MLALIKEIITFEYEPILLVMQLFFITVGTVQKYIPTVASHPII